MAITADYHLHSSFSSDSKASMESMILRGIELGLTHMCFTEHQDYDFPISKESPSGSFLVNVDSYLFDLLKYREKYADQIKVNFGIELGLQPHLTKNLNRLVREYDFDFIIGSSHVCNGADPYYPPFYEGREEEDCYREYFQCIIENIMKYDNFDVYGHLDYVVRYGPNKDANYTYELYKDLLDEILRLLIEKEKGIEINTGGINYHLKDLHPCTDAIRRYKELGGEIITIGSDAHAPFGLANGFDRAAEVLKECGFQYYTIFEKRVPEFKKL